MGRIHDQLRARRKQLGLHQSDMLLRAGIARQQYHRLENEGNPSLKTLDLAAAVAGGRIPDLSWYWNISKSARAAGCQEGRAGEAQWADDLFSGVSQRFGLRLAVQKS